MDIEVNFASDIAVGFKKERNSYGCTSINYVKEIENKRPQLALPPSSSSTLSRRFEVGVLVLLPSFHSNLIIGFTHVESISMQFRAVLARLNLLPSTCFGLAPERHLATRSTISTVFSNFQRNTRQKFTGWYFLSTHGIVANDCTIGA